MTNDDHTTDGDEATVQPATGQLFASGEFNGVPWTARAAGDHVQLTINERTAHVTPDGLGNYLTHEMVGRWPDLRELAERIIRYHPGFQPTPGLPVS